MTRKLITIITFLYCGNVFALSCNQLQKIASDNRVEFPSYIYENNSPAPTQYAPYQSKVKGNKGYRAYFHSAPASQCMIKNLFIIPNDVVNVNSSFQYQNQQWLHVTFWDKNTNETSGWILAKDLTEPNRNNE